MTEQTLIERLAGGVFDPPVAYHDLADYHLDFAKLTDARPEAEVRERAERAKGCCAVVGPSGSGKSSLIAAVAASLSPTRFPVRVQGLSNPDALTREGFALHIARETLRAVDAMESGNVSRRRLRVARGALASSSTRTSGGHGVKAALPLPAGLALELRASASEVVEERSPTSIAQAIDGLVAVTERFDRQLLLVVEDTDVFMPPDPIDDADRERPRRFVDQVLTYLARDFPSSSLVAVNDRYRALLPAGTLKLVDVPPLQPSSIGPLIEHYARQNGLHVSADEIADAGALAYAAGRYAESKDIRRMLEMLHKAARKMAGEGRGEVITAEVLHGL